MQDRDIRERVLEILGQHGRPTTERDLLKLLRVKGETRLLARQVLESMIARGELARTRRDRIGLPEKMNLLAGRLATKPGGFGFVKPDREGRRDVYIAGPALGEALNGDRVLVRVERPGRAGRYEGRIVEILERANARVVGRFESDFEGNRVVAFDPSFLHEIVIPEGEEGDAESGVMVVVEMTRYPSGYRAPAGRVLHVLGPIHEPGVDVEVIIHKYGLPDAFPADVQHEAEAIPGEVPAEAIARRDDFRARTIVTIDGETARDFDDAVEVESLENGNYLLGVHIADVSHYVAPGSRLDEEAFHRGTSVYFPERAIPMLPERLSNGICSLNPGVDRLTQSVCIEVSPGGRVVDYTLHDAVIRSAARMTYTEVRQILVDEDPEVRERFRDLIPVFERMQALFEILRARRERRGSIDFDLPEPEVLLDVEGLVTGVVAAERHLAHRLIEEFMLLANEVTARHLAQLEAPSLYRVHEPPDEDRVLDFEELISGFGHRLRASSETLRPKNFQKLLKRIEGTAEERLISFLMLRTMKQARYTMENSGHYALAAPIYTHFTSPIRRYPDLVVHRLLRELRHFGPPTLERAEAQEADLPAVADHSSITERRAEEAARALVEWKKIRFMADKMGEVFFGYVTGVTSFGFFVELEEYFVEGLVHISTLVDDYYRYNEKAHRLTGESTANTYQLGERVEVQVVRVDLEKRQIELALAGQHVPSPGRKQAKKPRPLKPGRKAKAKRTRRR